MPTLHVLDSISELPVWTSLRQCKDSIPCVYMYTPEMIISDIGGGKGGRARRLKPPLRMISHQNYLSWSGAENHDKDRDTLIEQSL